VGRGESAEEEFRNAWQSLGETLAAAGVGYHDIIDTTIYMVDL
jgi:enamine deaminase RidA (YjgF/YER057c/UK114 family)